MLRFFLIGITILLHSISLNAQFVEFFDSSLANWSGNTENFVINAENQLQLNAPEAGYSQLYRGIEFSDSMVFELLLEMRFTPSSNNKLRWHLWSDGNNLKEADGFFIEIGENGNDDALHFYSKRNGVETLLGSSDPGSVFDNPHLFLKVIVRSGNQWEILVDFEGTKFPQPIFSLTEPFDFDDKVGTHGIGLFYTSSRTESFLFDDWLVQPYMPDIQPPQLLTIEVIDPITIQLTFDEAIVESSIILENFRTIPLTGQALEYHLDNNTLQLTFDMLPLGQLFSLSINGIMDISGNKLVEIEVNNLLYALPPIKGELVISEILFNPIGTESDFVEIYNTTDKFLNIKSLEIHNLDNGQSHSFNADLFIFPGEYIAFSENVMETTMRYSPPDTSTIIETELPAFNNDEGNVTLIHRAQTLDTYDYNESHHNPIINNPDGVSLEKINLIAQNNTPANWTSAASTTRFGSPGYKNSATIDHTLSTMEFKLRSSSFSPNSDGFNDLLIIDYYLEKPGWVATIDLYSENGHHLKTITDNEILATKGYLTWNGLDKDNHPAKIGIYIIVINAFHTDGESKKYKFAATLNRHLR